MIERRCKIERTHGLEIDDSADRDRPAHMWYQHAHAPPGSGISLTLSGGTHDGAHRQAGRGLLKHRNNGVRVARRNPLLVKRSAQKSLVRHEVCDRHDFARGSLQNGRHQCRVEAYVLLEIAVEPFPFVVRRVVHMGTLGNGVFGDKDSKAGGYELAHAGQHRSPQRRIKRGIIDLTNQQRGSFRFREHLASDALDAFCRAITKFEQVDSRIFFRRPHKLPTRPGCTIVPAASKMKGIPPNRGG